MKKLLLLFLLVAGGVSTASATDYVIVGDNAGAVNGSDTWANNSDANTMIETSTGSGIYYLKVTTTLTAGSEVKAAPLVKNSWTRAFYDDDAGRTGDWTYGINVGETGSYVLYYYLDPENKIFDVFATPMLRSNIGNSGSGNFDWKYESVSDFTQDNYFTWHYDMPYASLDDENSFFIYTKVNYRAVYTYSNPKTEVTLPASITSTVYFNGDRYNWSTSTESYSEDHRWFFDKPDYACEFVRVLLTYDVASQGMSIKLTPYISKTISSEGYATFGSAAPVDFSGAIPTTPGNKFTAKKGVVNGDKTITWNDLTDNKLAANKGALLHGDADTYLIPVATSGDATSNDLVAITEERQVAQTEAGTGNNVYILSKVNDELGFYRPAAGDGSWCAAGTAYLSTSYSPSRGFFTIWDEVNAIETIKQDSRINGEVYNLAGQRMTKTGKGLYIVNGKKVIIK